MSTETDGGGRIRIFSVEFLIHVSDGDINVLVAKETTVEEGTVETSLLDLANHVDEHGVHVLALSKKIMLFSRRGEERVLGAKKGNLALEGLIDPFLTDLDETKHLGVLDETKDLFRREDLRKETDKERAEQDGIDPESGIKTDDLLVRKEEKGRIVSMELLRDTNGHDGSEKDLVIIPERMEPLQILLESMGRKGAIHRPFHRGAEKDNIRENLNRGQRRAIIKRYHSETWMTP